MFALSETPQTIQQYFAHDNVLRSKEWKRFRRRVLKRDWRLCWRCGGEATNVHHRSYESDVLAGDNDEQLASICEGCHTVIHYDDSGAKRTPEETDRLLFEKCHDTDIPVPKVDMRKSWPKPPQEWPRMTAVQRAVWHFEYSRIRLVRMMEKNPGGKK
jgi:5-methylcytosine-specific restriction endonuclease McrA